MTSEGSCSIDGPGNRLSRKIAGVASGKTDNAVAVINHVGLRIVWKNVD